MAMKKTPTRKKPPSSSAGKPTRAKASSSGNKSATAKGSTMALSTIRSHAKALGYRVIQNTPTGKGGASANA